MRQSSGCWRLALLSVGHIYGMASSPDLILQGAESGSFTLSTRTGGNWTLGPLPANPFFFLALCFYNQILHRVL